MVRTVADRYVVLPQEERSGGIARVVKATDGETGDQVALKLLGRADIDDTHRVFFQREVEALERLDHPNIVSLLDHGEDDSEDAFFLVFPWLERGLRDVVPPAYELGWDDFADRWGLPLLDALAYAHERDVVHRDVKPSNILIGDNGTALLADFGISKIRSHITSEATVAEFVSKPYAPPELDGMGRASRDAWGFAATTLKCLYDGTFTDYEHIEDAFADIDVPPDVMTLLRQCTARDPQLRPRSAIELRRDLSEIQQRRRRKWIAPRAAQLELRERAARGLLEVPMDRDPDAVEQALTAELAGGTHLARATDPGSGQQMPDTLDLIGERRRLRLVVLPGRPSFIVNGIYGQAEGLLEKIRREAWEVSDQVRWTTRNQPARDAATTQRMILAALDEHYLHQAEQQQTQEENRLFDSWLDLLSAKEDLERTRSGPLRYSSATVDGRRVRFTLDRQPDADIVGEERVCRVGRGEVVGGPGVVVAQERRVLTLGYPYRPKNIPPAGELVLDIGPSAAALRRQRDAVVDVRAEIAVRPQLRQLLVDPTQITVPAPVPEVSWFNDQLDGGKRTAVTRALGSPDFFLLEGPPGTGKTAFITELVRQELHRKPDARILLVSQTHVAVDNALVRLADAGVPELVRLGKTGDERVAEQARQHLLDARMPVWVRGIRERGEAYLAQLAAADGVDLAHCHGAAALVELIAALDDRDDARKGLDELTGPRLTTRSRSGGLDAEVASEAGALNDRLQLLTTRIADLRDRARAQLGTAPMDGLPGADEELTAEAVRAVMKTVVDADPKLRKLVGILTLQAEWFQRVESSKDLEAVLLRRARVVAGTCLGFLAHPAVRELEFDLCILDEASKATATETLVPLSRSKRWVLVGDPNQLPPMQEEVLDRDDLMTRHGLERADVERSLFLDLLDQTPATTRHQLTQQYRMHPAIGELVSECFYQGNLRSAASPELVGWHTLYAPVTWLDTGRSGNRRERRSGTTLSNHHEIQVIKRALGDLLPALEAGTVQTEDGGPLRVLVLTAYRKQMDELQSALAGHRSVLMDIEVNTVDAVQGREADITFYSVVRSNDSGTLGFLGGPFWRRINVALSRSRFGLVLVGDAPFCEKTTGPLQKVLTHMRKHPGVCRIETAQA